MNSEPTRCLTEATKTAETNLITRGERIEIRRVDLTPVAPEVGPAEIVCENNEDAWLCCWLRKLSSREQGWVRQRDRKERS